MFLTRAFLDPSSRAVRADLRSPEGLHKTIMRAFPDDAGPNARKTHGVLHRLDETGEKRLMLLVQSRTRPEVGRWPDGYLMADAELTFTGAENPEVKSLAPLVASFTSGARYRFRLRANTTRKIDTKSAPDGSRRNGRRVPLRGDDARVAWVVRKGAASGFIVDPAFVRVREVAPAGGRGGKGVVVAGALFDGVLRVDDAARFREAFADGIGPAKAYGFGLLSLAPVR